MLPERLLQFTTPQLVLGGQGHVILLDVMGDDAAVADAARTSYHGSAALREDRDEQKDAALIRRLIRDHHTGPFEQAIAKFHIRLPMDVHRQHVRHRTASLSEYSTRYKPAIDAALTTEPSAWRAQSKDNKQGSAGMVTEWPEGGHGRGASEDPTILQLAEELGLGKWASPGAYLSAREVELQEAAREVYEERLAFGVAREQARKDLPLSTMTEIVWSMDLKNLMDYEILRLDPHAQQEIREYAGVFKRVIEVWCPATYAAFVDWRLEAVTLSGPEIRALRIALQDQVRHDVPLRSNFRDALPDTVPAAELKDFFRKLGLEKTP